MKTLLAIVAAFALLFALLGVPDLLLNLAHGKPWGDGAFSLFVAAGGLSALIHYLQEIQREAKAQTKLLGEIAAQGRKDAGAKAVSSVRYEAPE